MSILVSFYSEHKESHWLISASWIYMLQFSRPTTSCLGQDGSDGSGHGENLPLPGGPKGSIQLFILQLPSTHCMLGSVRHEKHSGDPASPGDSDIK